MLRYAITGELHTPDKWKGSTDHRIEVYIDHHEARLVIGTLREIRNPLQVGDELDEWNPEPPDKTVLVSGNGVPYRRDGDYWYVPGDPSMYRWEEDVRPQAQRPVRVVYIATLRGDS